VEDRASGCLSFLVATEQIVWHFKTLRDNYWYELTVCVCVCVCGTVCVCVCV